MPKFDLVFATPLLNAAGSLGFYPEANAVYDPGNWGAFVTNPISYTGRTPAHSRQVRATPGGFLLHSGYPNPGIRQALVRYGPRWARSPIPVIVHLLAPKPVREELGRLAQMMRMLEGQEGVMGIELGLPPGVGLSDAQILIEAALGELPLIVRLPLDLAVHLAAGEQPGKFRSLLWEAAAISLGPARGLLPEYHIGQGQTFTSGRLYGPALFPQALESVHRLAALEFNVIGAGGVYTRENVSAMLSAGAFAVQLDSVLWRGGVDVSQFVPPRGNAV